MKRNIIALAILTILNFQLSVCFAQPQQNQGERRAERMADEFQLKGEQRSQFMELMKAYRTEMRGAMVERPNLPQPVKGGQVSTGIAPDKAPNADAKSNKKGEKKNKGDKKPEAKGGNHHPAAQLTDEQAQEQLDKYFERQEKQIEMQQKRLEIDRNYYAKFKQLLTPAQMLRIFREPRQFNQQQRPGNGQHHNGFGGPGGNRGGFGEPGGGFGGPGGGFGGPDGGF